MRINISFPKIQLFLILSFSILPILIQAQTFVNGDLDGTVAVSSSPTGWNQVSYNDPVSTASSSSQATSDITATSGPATSAGVNGNPHSGTSFVSGINGTLNSYDYHEGLKQSLSGFTIGSDYTLEFYQANVKQSNALDQSGSWDVYLDNTLLFTTTPTTSTLAYNSNALVWEHRSITFTATATSFTFKFMPSDDDSNRTLGNSTSGAIRMGIDNISLTPVILSAELVNFSGEAKNNGIELFWETASEENNYYFTLEHSSDGISWEAIGEIEGAGNSTERLAYSYFDNEPVSGTNYYRLKQTEYNGFEFYSPTIAISFSKEYSISLYPNPATTQVTIDIDTDLINPIVTIYDFSGQKYILPSSQVGNKLSLDVSSLSQGLYFVELQIGNTAIRKTIQINKNMF